jgi:tRNA(Ile)-lysidine synthase
MYNYFLKYIKEGFLFEPQHRLLLAVSGGVDSVVMVDLCAKAKLNFALIHCNFQLRGEASDGDEVFVSQLAKSVDAQFFVKKIDTKKYAKKHNISTQMAARTLRYAWFEEIRSSHSFDWVVVAHHRNDLLETVLLNLSRGTGLAGLHGILPKNGRIVRPLLFADRVEIERYALTNHLQWREDASNESDDYQRNLIRHKIVPVLEQLNPRITQAVAQTARIIEASERLIGEVLQKIPTKSHQNTIEIALPDLTEDTLIFYLHRFGFSFEQALKIWQLRTTTETKIFESPAYQLNISRGSIVIVPKEELKHTTVVIDQLTPKIETPVGTLTMQMVERSAIDAANNDKHTAYFDADVLEFPLKIRKWVPGDYFFPLGMNHKKKKVSDYLVNIKLAKHLKEQVYVLESNQKIAWIIGHRTDEIYRVKINSKKNIQIKIRSIV